MAREGIDDPIRPTLNRPVLMPVHDEAEVRDEYLVDEVQPEGGETMFLVSCFVLDRITNAYMGS